MKLITLIVLGLASITLNAEVIDAGSHEEAAKIVVDRICGGDGEILNDVWVDEDWEFVAHFVELSNGSATVYTFSSEARNGGGRWGIYHEVEEGNVVCTNTRQI